MVTMRRKTTPKVKSGRVCKKHNHKLTPHYWQTPQKLPVLDRERPGRGYRHLLRKKDIVSFISILPDWDELSIGLDAVLLAAGEFNTSGWYNLGIVAICAWDRDLWHYVQPRWYRNHKALLDRLNVPCFKDQDSIRCEWTEDTAKAYQLLHIFLHELGHHHDRITTRSRRRCARGESYAEKYALKYERTIWHRYTEVFGF